MWALLRETVRGRWRGRAPACLARIVLTLALVSVRCGGHDDFRYEGTGSTPFPITFVADVPLARVTVDDQPEQLFLLDTGSPGTLLDPAALEPAPLPGRARLGRLSLLGVTILDPEVGVDALFGDGFATAGIVGGDVLGHFALTLDYQSARAVLWPHLGGALPPLESETLPDPAQLPFARLGGGAIRLPNGDTLSVGATRVTLWLSVEGHPALGVVDTGASLTVLDEPLYQTLLVECPDRPRLTGLRVLTLEGAVEAQISRAARMALLDADPRDQAPPADATAIPGAALASVPILVLEGSQALAGLSAETGRTVQVLLGASFLRAFQITVDYPAETLTLQRYRTLDHIDPEEWVSVGFTWNRDPTGPVLVEAVMGDTDAEAQGLQAGDEILTAGAHDITLEGSGGVQAAVDASALGDRVVFRLERDSAPYDAAVRIEDLLPPFESPGSCGE